MIGVNWHGSPFCHPLPIRLIDGLGDTKDSRMDSLSIGINKSCVWSRDKNVFCFKSTGAGEAMLPQMIDVELNILHKASPYIDSQQTKPNKNNMDGN